MNPKSREAIIAPSTAMPTMVWDTAKNNVGAVTFATAWTARLEENNPDPNSVVKYAAAPTPTAANVDRVKMDLNVAIASSVLLESIKDGSFVWPS
mmetsp:Transcript_13710/g.29861  ORF Transcript_13710/g.29861 Transcript_13710/m.29861 type:complete len:95 (+) Transcript_13710:455-739(+)